MPRNLNFNFNVRKRGLTLLELTVAVAIMAILSGLVMAGLNTARKASDRASAVAAMRLIGSGLSLYVVSNGGVLPHFNAGSQPVTADALQPGHRYNAVGAIAPFIGAENIQRGQYVPGTAGSAFLREFPRTTRLNPLPVPGWTMDSDTTFAYAIPGSTLTDDPEHRGGSPVSPYPFGFRDGRGLPLRHFTIADPSRQVALIEFDSQLRALSGGLIGANHPFEKPLHGDVRVALFFDWHVEMIPVDRNFYFDKQW